MFAVGPTAEGAWLDATRQTNGRVRALGTRWDNECLYAAADIYLDSVPFSSITSLLEAGSHAIPLLGYISPSPDLSLLGPGAPGLDVSMHVAANADLYESLLVRLMTDVEFRRESGQRVRKAILDLHTGEQWSACLKKSYAKAEATSERGCFVRENDRFASDPLTISLDQLYRSVPTSTRRLIRESLCMLPYLVRSGISWRLCRLGLGLSVLNMLPSPVDSIIQSVGRRARRYAARSLSVLRRSNEVSRRAV